MRSTEVIDPQGFRWVVKRRWTPRWTRVDVGRRFQRVRRRRRSDDGTEIEREVVGWRASRAQIESMRRALESGFDV